MCLSDLNVLIPLSGAVLGVVFGLMTGVLRETKLREAAIVTYGGIVVGITGLNFLTKDFSFATLLQFVFWSGIGFLLSLMIGLYYNKRVHGKVFAETVKVNW